ncbi:MAG: hypothetical protein AMS27_06245 [Bacteroides sp. SM23_62_1]|nr:MAG: hypothetical protein AMS27_06245 [Bacteroides sp. SM23_62_1]
MNLIIVNDKKTRQEFLDVPKILYKHDDTWVCPLDKDIEAIFDPEKNSNFNNGEADRWILKDDHGHLAGRIAAFIDYNTASSHDQPTGGIGFFECINNQKAAFLLFNTAEEWLKGKGMEAMDGPINFGERDRYWGLLVDGFTHPSYEVAYNHRYYRELFELYGFKTYFKQEGFHLDITKKLPDRFIKIAEWVTKKPEYRFEHMSWKNLHKQIPDFVEVYNTAWASFAENFKPLKSEYVIKTLKKVKPVIEEEFIWLAYHKDIPISIYLMYPDVNQVLKYFNGRLNLFHKLKFLYLIKKKTITRARGVLMGVIPKYQGLGIESVFIMNLAKVFERKPHYKELEFSWVGDFNPKMKKIFLSVGSVTAKEYITYRYLFDRNKSFKRYPIPE